MKQERRTMQIDFKYVTKAYATNKSKALGTPLRDHNYLMMVSRPKTSLGNHLMDELVHYIEV